MRHLAGEAPIPLPQGVGLRDADLRRWRRDVGFGLEALADDVFDRLAAEGARRYERERTGLREACRQVVAESADLSAMAAPDKAILTTWLVQQLCVERLLWDGGTPSGKAALREAVEAQVAQLRQAGGVRATAGPRRGRAAAAGRDWAKLVSHCKDDLQQDEGGDYVFRMTSRSQTMVGDTRAATRRTRQASFNHPQLNPRILVGQSDVMSEGLNLHRSCRTVVLFHLDWNPGRIEQQIGRVDRQHSAWMDACRSALATGSPLPTLDIHSLTVEGTYDSLRAEVVAARTRVFRAQMFGEILPAERLAELSDEARQALAAIRIDFRPSR